MSNVLNIGKRIITDFFEDDAMTLAGALAYYTALSMAPLLILIISVAGFLWKDDAVSQQVVDQSTQLMGEGGGEMVSTIIQSSGEQQMAGIGAIIGIATLIFGATSVFAQLQYSLNRIWNVRAKPGNGVWQFIRKRLLSLGMIFAIAFLLLVSLAASAALGYASSSAQLDLPGGAMVWNVVNYVVSFLVYAAVFTAILKYFPDVTLSWRTAAIGGAFTALLFAIGKELLGWYLGQASTSSAYGAAGSLLIVLLWVYYSSLILFLGAEFTQVYAAHVGEDVVPEQCAEVASAPAPTHKPTRQPPPKPQHPRDDHRGRAHPA